jgi:glutamate synthase (ferredoxin)
MASEVGVLDIKPERIKYSGRLEPGKIFFIDTELKRIIGDSEIKSDIANEKPYEKWLKENIVDIKNVKAVKI